MVPERARERGFSHESNPWVWSCFAGGSGNGSGWVDWGRREERRCREEADMQIKVSDDVNSRGDSDCYNRV